MRLAIAVASVLGVALAGLCFFWLGRIVAAVVAALQ
jgi:hypothetical protein